ncbi:hypothetical protein CF319_g416 [Tilletia indica]|uniref:Tubulin-specific chaperone A n=2 Tax=Tilletia TaxID=13289 RepID=A0A8X7T7S1_9BASI|nr:hypothetical protein CF327_g440 [Tilletia walkeri]KAE8227065.1 hypothetical protein CF319_g416 [Tilletia indica]KAE8229756.1 hypothetical protein CF326_g5269 [Tilletia indica]KAE8258222.1 hypothetical protein A4X13_0g1824 [Tilletia indica]KAE8272112.1 hypothetical protein A4X09_0g214 [Tilletia walkeri]
MSDILKQLKIKTGVINRLVKEEVSYKKEVEQQEKHIQSLIDDGQDKWTVNKQKEVLQESRVMIPDTQRRLQAAISDLDLLLEDLDDSNREAAEAVAAREALQKATEAQAQSQAEAQA